MIQVLIEKLISKYLYGVSHCFDQRRSKLLHFVKCKILEIQDYNNAISLSFNLGHHSLKTKDDSTKDVFQTTNARIPIALKEYQKWKLIKHKENKFVKYLGQL
jgi:hypothetical protein